MGKYRALQDHLASAAGPVRMSFEDIERLVGPLPASARQYRPWWANTRENRSQARAWLNAGYAVGQVTSPHRRDRRVPPGHAAPVGSRVRGV